ncbi:hypothetical protein B0H21DRAFT_817716 [Amylocystis lapponica]|nr:hypothetical protein B0H21DRAFT_817716 [Amylocystis lapponica]
MTPNVKRTYGTRTARPSLPSSPPSSPAPLKRKRPLVERSAVHNTPPSKKQRRDSQSVLNVESKPPKKPAKKAKEKQPQKKLTQLHFSLDTTVIRTCPLCDLSYTKGAPDDESLHRTHCARVRRGLEWGREEEREIQKAAVDEVATGVKLNSGDKGRIISFRSDVGGKIGAKLATLLETIALALSSPPLSQAVLQRSKIYLFLLPSTSASTSATSSPHLYRNGHRLPRRSLPPLLLSPPSSVSPSTPTPTRRPLHTLIPVDTSTNLYVHPAPLPTPLGIPRLFVAASHRRLGIASHLLTAAAATAILGCPLDPTKGEIAFTQPTGAGKAVLEAWGKGGVRIYEEEQMR